MYSLSNGCYATIPKKRKQPVGFNFSSASWYRHYSKLWKQIESKIKNVKEEIYKPLNTDITKFIEDLEYSSERIPTIGLFTGINLPDHEQLFDSIKQNIEQLSEKNCLIVDLNPARANSLRSLIESTVFSFITYTQKKECETSLEESNIRGPKRSKRTLPYLLEWYQEEFGNNDNSPYMVIIVPNVEAFPSNILEDFLIAFSIYRDKMPLIFFFGFPTSMNRIHNIFSTKILSKLSIHFFQTQPSVIFIDKVLEETFLTDDCYFILGGKVFEFLTNVFLYYNFSIKEFVRGIQLCLMEHFYQSQNAFLCCFPNEMQKMIDSCDDNEQYVQELLSLSTLKNHNKRRKMDKLPELTDKSPNIMKELEKLLIDFHRILQRFRIAVRCLHTFMQQLNTNSLRVSLRDAYIETMSSTNITKSKWFTERLLFMKALSKDALLTGLNDILTILPKHSKDEKLAEFSNNLKIHVEKVKKSKLDKTTHTPEKSPVKINLAVKTREDFTKNLKSNATKEKARSEFDIAKNDVLEFLEECFGTFLQPLNKQTLHELFIFEDINIIEERLIGMPRLAVNTALEHPINYLNCECCKTDSSDNVLNKMPDICIMYKLHRECGDRINLCDWFQQFRSVVDEANGQDGDIDPEIYARYLHAVKELHYLGFISRPKRKTNNVEYVNKLTF